MSQTKKRKINLSKKTVLVFRQQGHSFHFTGEENPSTVATQGTQGTISSSIYSYL